MAGTSTFTMADPMSGYVVPGVSSAAPSGGPTHMAFIVWLVLLGLVLPVAILGGLKVGGYSFVFRGR